MAALTGLYPKTDCSHGFPNPHNYEMYRDFQENTINSDVFSFQFQRISDVFLGLVRYVDFVRRRHLLDSLVLQLYVPLLLGVN